MLQSNHSGRVILMIGGGAITVLDLVSGESTNGQRCCKIPGECASSKRERQKENKYAIITFSHDGLEQAIYLKTDEAAVAPPC